MEKLKKDIFEDEKKAFRYQNMLTHAQYNSTNSNSNYIYPDWPPSYLPTNFKKLLFTMNYKYFYLLITNYSSFKKNKWWLFYIPISFFFVLLFINILLIVWLDSPTFFAQSSITLYITLILTVILTIVILIQKIICWNDILLYSHLTIYFSTIFKCNSKQEVIKVINNLYTNNKINYSWYKILYLWFYVEFSNEYDKTSVYTYHQLKMAFGDRNRKGRFFYHTNHAFYFRWDDPPRKSNFHYYIEFAWEYPSLRDCSKWVIINNIKPPLCLPKDQKKCNKEMKKYLVNRKKFNNIMMNEDKKCKVNSEWKKIMTKEIMSSNESL